MRIKQRAFGQRFYSPLVDENIPPDSTVYQPEKPGNSLMLLEVEDEDGFADSKDMQKLGDFLEANGPIVDLLDGDENSAWQYLEAANAKGLKVPDIVWDIFRDNALNKKDITPAVFWILRAFGLQP